MHFSSFTSPAGSQMPEDRANEMGERAKRFSQRNDNPKRNNQKKNPTEAGSKALTYGTRALL
jgi:hypothetical protein